LSQTIFGAEFSQDCPHSLALILILEHVSKIVKTENNGLRHTTTFDNVPGVVVGNIIQNSAKVVLGLG